ncbi:Ig-like domain-containing protein, partial [Salmonella enterica]|uniref:Ig-like domain-containing protein n=1 Tax=Salmonella sp. 14ESS1484 TaxID=2933314 RepID=UPI001FF2D045
TLSPKNVTVLNYQLKQVTFDYSALPSGKYTATGAATDTYNNTAELTLSNTILHDVTPPVVDISFEGKQADGALVTGLENLEITLADDMTKASLKSITLSGGPTSDKVSVGWYSQGTDKYGLNYPRIFPATDDADSYQLTAVAVDEAGNTTTKVSRFRYVPNNLI